MERLCGLFTVHSEKVLFLSMVSCYNKKTIRSVIVTGQGAAGRPAGAVPANCGGRETEKERRIEMLDMIKYSTGGAYYARGEQKLRRAQKPPAWMLPQDG